MNKLYVINLGRELGSGGRQIGEVVASRLGIKFYDKALLRLAAEHSGLCKECFEKVDESTSKWKISELVDFVRNQFSTSANPSGDVLGEQSIFEISSELIATLSANDSCLFVGRCADYILREHPCAINIFISANQSDRVKRIMELNDISESEATKKIKEIDGKRAAYYNYYSTKTWGKASSYDLCINSSILGIEGTAEFIIDYVKQTIKR
ncbi:MAG: cytidylate kinase-like family protein [Rikenellaceae bacterium]